MDYSRDLVAPQQLNPGDNLFSATRSFQLKFQTDGNLVLYAIDDATLPVDITQATYSKVIWNTQSNGKGANRCVMQADGNLVVYNNNTAIWSSHTSGHPGSFLRCQDDGNLVVYGPDGSVPWFSNTFAGRRGAANQDTLGSYPPQPPPTPPPQTLWFTADGSAPGSGNAGGTLIGSGFASDQCSVLVDGAGFIGAATYTGSISKGIKIKTPCANAGQPFTVHVNPVNDPSQTVKQQFVCYTSS